MQPQRILAWDYLDVGHFVELQAAQVHGLAKLIAQPKHVRKGGATQRFRGGGIAHQVCQGVVYDVIAVRIAHHISHAAQRGEDPEYGGLRDARTLCDLIQPQGAGSGQFLENTERTPDYGNHISLPAGWTGLCIVGFHGFS